MEESKVLTVCDQFRLIWKFKQFVPSRPTTDLDHHVNQVN